MCLAGLPIQVRDTGLSVKDEVPRSDVNKEYYTQNMEREVWCCIWLYSTTTMCISCNVAQWYRVNLFHNLNMLPEIWTCITVFKDFSSAWICNITIMRQISDVCNFIRGGAGIVFCPQSFMPVWSSVFTDSQLWWHSPSRSARQGS